MIDYLFDLAVYVGIGERLFLRLLDITKPSTLKRQTGIGMSMR
jgi:hypothetical protein